MAAPVIAERKHITVALAGNPNVGKSTLFNALTGLHQHVGNWTGKTVERKEGDCVRAGRTYRLIDLPGTYSLSALSPEELIAREFVAREHPDVVVNLVDASNLERNLYLTLQLLELTDRVVVVLNMMDLARARGLTIDVAALSGRLGVPVIPVVAERREGLEAVMEAIARVATTPPTRPPLRVQLPPELLVAVTAVAEHLPPDALEGFSPPWFARKLLEGDAAVWNLARQRADLAAACEAATTWRSAPELADFEGLLIAAQYEALGLVMAACTHRAPSGAADLTDRLDGIVTHRLLGFPVLFAVFGLMFWITFSLAKPINELLAALLARVGAQLEAWLVALGAPSALQSFVLEGLWAGFSTVAGFFPLIALFFTLFAILEDSGYLARAAFVVDRFMGAMGLHGRSFLPLLMGFGCNVPAVMATRIIEGKSDRLLTILVNPLMVCQARLVVFVFFAGTFFTGMQATLVMLSLYGLSLALVLGISVLFKRVLFPGEPSVFIMELPPYHRPVARNVLTQAWSSARGFLVRAAGQITLMTAAIWLFTHLPAGGIEHSLAGMVGHALAPIGVPLGFDWRLLVSLLGGFLAKEGAIASLAVIYGVGPEGLGGALRASMSPLVGYVFMVVSLVYVPCYSTLVAIWRETLSWKWTAFSAIYGLALAFALGAGIYQLGRMFGLS